MHVSSFELTLDKKKHNESDCFICNNKRTFSFLGDAQYVKQRLASQLAIKEIHAMLALVSHHFPLAPRLSNRHQPVSPQPGKVNQPPNNSSVTSPTRKVSQLRGLCTLKAFFWQHIMVTFIWQEGSVHKVCLVFILVRQDNNLKLVNSIMHLVITDQFLYQHTHKHVTELK